MLLKRLPCVAGLLVLGCLAGCGGGGAAPPAAVPVAPALSLLAGSLGGAGAVDGPAAQAQFNRPTAAVEDASGTVYVTDTGNHTIRRISAAGIVGTLAGSAGQAGSSDGAGGAARFNQPGMVAVGPSGELFVGDSNGLRRVDPAGVTTTILAGDFSRTPLAVDAGGTVYCGDSSGVRRVRPGAPAEAFVSQIGPVVGLSVDGSGFIYVQEQLLATSRRFHVGDQLRRYAPDGKLAPWPAAPTGVLLLPIVTSIAVGKDGTVAVIQASILNDAENQPEGLSVSVNRIDASGQLRSLAGGVPGYADGQGALARFLTPSTLAASTDGRFLLADSLNNAIRKIDAAGNVSTLAGTPDIGERDGAGADARFFNPTSIAAGTDDTLLVADRDNARIRRVRKDGQVSSLTITAGGQVTPRLADWQVLALAVGPTGRTFFCGRWTRDAVLPGQPSPSVTPVRPAISGVVELANGSTSGLPFADRFVNGCFLPRERYVPDDSLFLIGLVPPPPGLSLQHAVLAASETSVYWAVSDYGLPTSTAAGISRWRGAATELLPITEKLSSIAAMAVDRNDNLYVATFDNLIWIVDPLGKTLYFAGARGIPSYADGPRGSARFDRIAALALDPSGTLYVADATTVRRIGADGVVTTLAGTAGKEGVSPGPLPGVLSGVKGLAWSGDSLYATVRNALVRIGPVVQP